MFNLLSNEVCRLVIFEIGRLLLKLIIEALRVETLSVSVPPPVEDITLLHILIPSPAINTFCLLLRLVINPLTLDIFNALLGILIFVNVALDAFTKVETFKP